MRPTPLGLSELCCGVPGRKGGKRCKALINKYMEPLKRLKIRLSGVQFSILGIAQQNQ